MIEITICDPYYFNTLFKNKLTGALQEKQVVVCFKEDPVLPLIFSKPFDWI